MITINDKDLNYTVLRTSVHQNVLDTAPRVGEASHSTCYLKKDLYTEIDRKTIKRARL